jgi:transposase
MRSARRDVAARRGFLADLTQHNLKQYRALATRYDKLANTFLAAVALVCVLFWLN